MKKSKFSEEQIVFALKQHFDLQVPVAEITRRLGICEATFYRWHQKYGGLSSTEMKRMKQLEEENRRLRELVAGLSLDKQMLQEIVQKKL